MRAHPGAQTWRTALAVLAVAGSASAAHADDTSPGVPLPPLHASPAGALCTAQAALQIAGRRVRLALALAPRGAGTAVALSWQSERIAWMGYGETYPDRQFPELAFELDGAPVSAASHDEAMLGADDISTLVAAAGLDPFSITETPPFAAPRAGADRPADPSAATAAHAELLRRGAIEAAKEGELAKWTVRRHLELALAPGAHRLRVAYDARPGIEPATRAALVAPATARRYCIAATAVPKALAAGGWVIERYDLPAGLDGTPPGRATLAIDADPKAGPARWFACGPGGRPIAVAATLAPTAVQPDAQGVVHVLRLSPATPD